MNDNPTIVDWEIEATCDLAVQLVAGCFAGPPDGKPPVLLAVQVGTWASATLQAGEQWVFYICFSFPSTNRKTRSPKQHWSRGSSRWGSFGRNIFPL